MDYKFAIKEPLSLRLYSPIRSTGFRYQEIKKDSSFFTGNKDYNHLLFVLEGEVRISCNEFNDRYVYENEFLMIPIAADVSCKALTSCRVICFSFESLFDASNVGYLSSLKDIASQVTYDFKPLPVRNPLEDFIDLLSLYFKQGLNKSILHDIKHFELQIILRSFYSKKEIASLYYPLIAKSTSFRISVMRNYRKVNEVEELATILGLEKRTFARRFKEEFNEPPYQWLLTQKAKHIRYSLAETDQSLESIRQEHGFKFAGHFTRFCKEQFDATPSKLLKTLRDRKL